MILRFECLEAMFYPLCAYRGPLSVKLHLVSWPLWRQVRPVPCLYPIISRMIHAPLARSRGDGGPPIFIMGPCSNRLTIIVGCVLFSLSPQLHLDEKSPALASSECCAYTLCASVMVLRARMCFCQSMVAGDIPRIHTTTAKYINHNAPCRCPIDEQWSNDTCPQRLMHGANDREEWRCFWWWANLLS